MSMGFLQFVSILNFYTELRKKTDAVTSACGQAWIKPFVKTLFFVHLFTNDARWVCVRMHVCVRVHAFIYFVSVLKTDGSLCWTEVVLTRLACDRWLRSNGEGVLVEVQFAYFRCAVNRTEGSEVVRTVAPCSSCLSDAARATTGNNPLALLWVQTYVTV